MHALQLPPGHLWRVTLLAALLALAVMAMLNLPLGGLGSTDRSERSSAAGRMTSSGPALVDPTTRSDAPRWVTNPMAPPALGR